MPYNTRRVSLSLSELGVHVPNRARAPSQPTLPSQEIEHGDLQPPNKKARCVPQFVPSPGSMSPPKTAPIQIKKEETQTAAPRGAENTPPPSPGIPGRNMVDTQGIKDEVVVGAIVQLEKTGNRPHTSKELAAALALTVPTIETSTNPNALIQARLATYLKGPWPIVSPCPIGKQQENIHPRRVFYYLTSMPHQPIPDTSNVQQRLPPRVISPTPTSVSDEEMEDKYSRDRSRLSPSPEVDLTSPDLEDSNDNDIEHASMYSSRSSLTRDMSTAGLAHNTRAVSPPLETEERDFKQTANQLQAQRRDSLLRSREVSEASVKVEEVDDKASEMSVDVVDESDESIAKRSSEEAAALFGTHNLPPAEYGIFEFSSPVLRPQNAAGSKDAIVSKTVEVVPVSAKSSDMMVVTIEKDDPMDVWTWEMAKNPEDMDLEELEDLFDMC